MKNVKNRKPFHLVIKNSPVHTHEFCRDAIQNAANSVNKPDKAMTYHEASELASQVNLKGKATVVSGSRDICRKAARVIRELGGDNRAASILSNQPGWDKVDWTAPLPTIITR